MLELRSKQESCNNYPSRCSETYKSFLLCHAKIPQKENKKKINHLILRKEIVKSETLRLKFNITSEAELQILKFVDIKKNPKLLEHISLIKMLHAIHLAKFSWF